MHEGWNCGFMLYNQGRSRAPFRLAAVCRRWRRVAISTSILWTYIAVHKPGSAVALSRISLLASRSRQAPVDIVLPFLHTKPASFNEADNVSNWNNLMKIVAGMSYRWYCVEWTSFSTLEDLVLEALRGPTPLLVALSLEPYGRGKLKVSAQGLDYFLPHAPSLKTLRVEQHDTTTIWRISHKGFQSLTTLTLWEDSEQEGALHALRAALHTIRELNLGIIVVDWLQPPTEVIEFPHLEVLSLREVTWPLIFVSLVFSTFVWLISRAQHSIACSPLQLPRISHSFETHFWGKTQHHLPRCPTSYRLRWRHRNLCSNYMAADLSHCIQFTRTFSATSRKSILRFGCGWRAFVSLGGT